MSAIGTPDPTLGNAAPSGVKAAAFFDMDHTVVRGNTASVYLRDMRRRGELSRRNLARMSVVLVRYRMALIDMRDVMARVFEALEGTPEDALRDRCQTLFDREIRPLVSDDARRAVERHRAQGHPTVILTAQTPYLAEPLAREIGCEHVLSTRLEVQGGRFTGRAVLPMCYGDGKVAQASEWARDHGVSLARSYFYTDSYTDLPMLLAVGEPRAVGPDARLWVAARRRGWPVLRFA